MIKQGGKQDSFHLRNGQTGVGRVSALGRPFCTVQNLESLFCQLIFLLLLRLGGEPKIFEAFVYFISPKPLHPFPYHSGMSSCLKRLRRIFRPYFVGIILLYLRFWATFLTFFLIRDQKLGNYSLT